MGRYEDLMKMINPEVTATDEQTKADNPRNWLAGKVNPALDEYINPHMPDSFKLNIPTMTVADQKRYDSELPENMAGAAMGSIKNVGNGASGVVSKFGQVLHEPGATPNLGSVNVLPSAADKAVKAIPGKPLEGTAVSNRFKELFGEATNKEVESVARSQKLRHKDNPGAYDSWKQEQLDAIRRGEK